MSKMSFTWRDCAKKLPTVSGDYVTVDMDSDYPFVRVVHYSALWRMWNCYDSFDRETAYGDFNVTHWAPCPKLPEVRHA